MIGGFTLNCQRFIVNASLINNTLIIHHHENHVKDVFLKKKLKEASCGLTLHIGTGFGSLQYKPKCTLFLPISEPSHNTFVKRDAGSYTP